MLDTSLPTEVNGFEVVAAHRRELDSGAAHFTVLCHREDDLHPWIVWNLTRFEDGTESVYIGDYLAEFKTAYWIFLDRGRPFEPRILPRDASSAV